VFLNDVGRIGSSPPLNSTVLARFRVETDDRQDRAQSMM
jgi:hypothetical protein